MSPASQRRKRSNSLSGWRLKKWASSAKGRLSTRAWLTLHLDRHSAQMIYDALMGNPATATPEHGLAEVIGEWLSPSSETR